MNFEESKIYLHVEYKVESQKDKKTVFPINLHEGIKEPFDMKNKTEIQLFLLQVERFHLKVENLVVKENWEGFSEKYKH